MISFSADPGYDKKRVDHIIAAEHPGLSRSFVQSLCKTGKVRVNNKPVKSGFRVMWGDQIQVDYDLSTMGVVPEITLPILYENDDVLVVDKPAGILSHALSKFKAEPSVASFLRQRLHATERNPVDVRYGIVHRLDRATSGVMVCAKNRVSMSVLQKQFADRSVEKEYVAVVTGKIEPEQAIIKLPIERNPKKPATFRVGNRGKPATTQYQRSVINDQYSLVHLWPKTGRTHQLRVHLSHQHHPIVGDRIYGHADEDQRLYLHAYRISLVLPGDSAVTTFTAEIPSAFSDIIEAVK
jgi:23S rRNA pseudouridine1911/1915/1917 synthase